MSGDSGILGGSVPSTASVAACIPRVVMNCALLSDTLNICHLNFQSICARQLSKFNELKSCIMNSKLEFLKHD